MTAEAFVFAKSRRGSDLRGSRVDGRALTVVAADDMGMCFGVQDALKLLDTVEKPNDVTIYGELVHNASVLESLRGRGFRMLPENDRSLTSATETVLVTAHGISDTERSRLTGANKHLLDTTCPLVLRVHQAAQDLQDAGFFVVVIGRRDHVEVKGILEDLTRYACVLSADEVVNWNEPKIGVVAQSTTPNDRVIAVRAAIEAKNAGSEILYRDTICHPTKDRQKAMTKLLAEVEAVVVVGGHNSNNTKELVTKAQQAGRPAIHIQGPADLDANWFAPFRVVGLTAGTSTLETTIREVHDALVNLDIPRSVASAGRTA